MLHNILECSRMLQNVLECLRMLHNALNCFRMLHIVTSFVSADKFQAGTSSKTLDQDQIDVPNGQMDEMN